MFISLIFPVIIVYTVKDGQRKGSKHVINFPQNMSRIATVLPQLPSDIPLIVRREGEHNGRYYDFRVRRDKTRSALLWLIRNNKWYRNIHISEERLSQLPVDGNLEELFLLLINNPQAQNAPSAPIQAAAAVTQDNGNNADNLDDIPGMTQ
jgi:hypothetical protein